MPAEPGVETSGWPQLATPGAGRSGAARSSGHEIARERSLRAARDRLVDQLSGGTLAAEEFARAYAEAADAHMQALLEEATGGKTRGYALLAVGGYGRGQLCPGSDLDLMLLHRGRRRYREVAERIWYALWDEGLHLDHSVRSRSEALTLAREDLKVLLGLLDARLVAGDEKVAAPLFEGVAELTRREGARVVTELSANVDARHEKSGELAFLLEPDLKQSAGGLRDAAALRALRRTAPHAVVEGEIEHLERAERLVTATRCALHSRTGSGSDRLALQEQDLIAGLVGFSDADALMAALAEAGRAVSSALEEAARRSRSALSAGPREAAPIVIEPGVALRGGEAALSEDADIRGDPSLALRLARVAAERHLLIDPASLDRLARAARRPKEPWSEDTRAAFVGLLSTGQALVPAIEALDRRRLFELYLPEWRVVRNRPQRNAYHRFTVDRHLLEAVAACGPRLGEVDRPDLLVLAALLHDLGKGFPGDHSEVGRELAENAARRMGLGAGDAAVLGRVVAYHLLLPEFATRRDLDDPSTAGVVARILEDRRTLDLLAVLAEADGQATGSAAWGPWKAELVAKLADRVARVLDGRELPAPLPPTPPEALATALAEGRLGLHASGRHLTVVAPDRPGLLAAVTGVLALHGCNVLRASAGEAEGGMAVEAYDVSFTFRVPEWPLVEQEVAGALAGTFPLAQRLVEQEQTYARARRPLSAAAAQVSVRIDDATSERATIVEVRAADRLGLLHRIAATLTEAGLDVAAALVDTLGHEVVDAFYVRGGSGSKIGARSPEAERVRTLLYGVLADG